MNFRPSSRAMLSFALLTALVLFLYVPMFAHWRTTGDFVPHHAYVQRMVHGDGTVWQEVPNFAYHVLVAVPYALFGGTLELWGLGVSVALMLATASALWWSIRRALRSNSQTAELSWRAELSALGLTIAALLFAPLTLLSPENAYFGYLHPMVYHNPTMLPLRPVAWLMFVGVLFAGLPETQAQNGRVRLLRISLLALATLASLWAKPSFVLAFLPALVPFVALHLLLRRRLDAWVLMGGVLVPALALLGYQALSYSGGSIGFRPFEVFDLWAYHYNPQANQGLLFKWLMSSALPVALLLVDGRWAWRDTGLQLAWLTFLAACGQVYLFNDLAYPVDGNLTWNGQIAVMVLLFASLVYAVQQRAHWQRWQRIVLSAAFALHLLGGIHWFLLHLNADYATLINSVW